MGGRGLRAKTSEDLKREHFGDFTSNYKTERYAVYAQLELEIADNWHATAGLRMNTLKITMLTAMSLLPTPPIITGAVS